MTELQAAKFLTVCVVALALALLLNLVVEWMRFPPVFLARRFSYFRWKRLLAWSRMYRDLFGEAPPVEYFVDFVEDVGERWLCPASWPSSPSEWRSDCG